MADLLSIITDTFPANDDLGVPLKSQITISFSSHLDEDSVKESFFVEGPDTDQFVGVDLDLQFYPDNISQGDDFLESPGYKGIVQGEITFATVSGVSMTATFTPDQPLAALTDYTVHVSDLDGDLFTTFSGITYSGHVTFDFQTGSGSIQEVPTTVSTSVLTSLNQSTVQITQGPLKILKITPEDRAIEVDPDLEEITVEFNKELDPLSIDTDAISVKAHPATDHPNAGEVANGELAKTVTIDGKKITIKI